MTNPEWDELIDSIVGDVQQALGLEDHKLVANLYKLLMYETGDFFLPHRDGEKLDSMVATLVIGLPALHEGGELVIYHEGQQHEILFSGAASGYKLSYAAFYADCKHEVRPLHSGYRLCLTYNLTLVGEQGKKGLTAPSYSNVIYSLAKILSDWYVSQETRKLALTLDHRYTQAGLTLDGLKGIDRARAKVLFTAADQADCVAHLALLTFWEHGSAVEEFNDYSRSRRNWNNDEDASDVEHEMEDVFEHSLTVNHWLDGQGRKVNLGEIGFDEDEVVSVTSIDDWELSEEEFEGYTGNAGMTLERWYHRAVIVIWPRKQQFAILCEAGTDAAIGALASMVRGLTRASKAEYQMQREACLSFVNAIIESWRPSRLGWNSEVLVQRNGFPDLLCTLEAAQPMQCFISQVMFVDHDVQLGKSALIFCQSVGWKRFTEPLITLFESTTISSVARNVELVRRLSVQRDKNKERQTLCASLLQRVLKSILALDNSDTDNARGKQGWGNLEMDRSALVVALVQAMLAIEAENTLQQLIDYILRRDDQYPLSSVHLEAIFVLESRLLKINKPSLAIQHWLSVCRSRLEDCTVEVPQKPQNYRRAQNLSCRCADCLKLSEFLANPEQSELRLPLRKDRRQHLHNIIDSCHCDLTHVTEHRGSPHTLICTKTTASYERSCQRHDHNLLNLSKIRVLEGKLACQ